MTLDYDSTILILSGIKFVTVILGAIIIFLGVRAYRATRRRHMLWLTVGMAALTAGAISEGLAFQGLHWTLEQSHVFEAIVQLVAFGILIYSLFA